MGRCVPRTVICPSAPSRCAREATLGLAQRAHARRVVDAQRRAAARGEQDPPGLDMRTGSPSLVTVVRFTCPPPAALEPPGGADRARRIWPVICKATSCVPSPPTRLNRRASISMAAGISRRPPPPEPGAPPVGPTETTGSRGPRHPHHVRPAARCGRPRRSRASDSPLSTGSRAKVGDVVRTCWPAGLKRGSRSGPLASDHVDVELLDQVVTEAEFAEDRADRGQGVAGVIVVSDECFDFEEGVIG